MTTFDEREKAFENKFEHDMELQFKARARRNKMLGLWAAGLMGKSGADAEAYARTSSWPTSRSRATTTSFTR